MRMSKLTTYNVQRTLGHDLSEGLQRAVLPLFIAIGVGSLTILMWKIPATIMKNPKEAS